MNYGYLTRRVFKLKLDELRQAGGICPRYLRHKYQEDYLNYTGERSDKFISIYPMTYDEIEWKMQGVIASAEKAERMTSIQRLRLDY